MSTNKIIAEIICSPVGEGESVSDLVKAAVDVLNTYEGIRVMTHPMGTVIECDTLDQVFNVTELAHEAIFSKGANRVVTQLRIDDRRDKPRSMEDKVDSVLN